MIVGLGLDIVEIAQIQRMLGKRGEDFEQRVFTQGERDACAGRVDRDQALAARYAAKEACLKALGSGVSEGLAFQQVEVVDGEGGAPILKLTGKAAERAKSRGVRQVHVTLSHQPGVAAAAVILEG